MDLKNKNIIITGASKGIGNSLLLKLIGKGSTVFVWGMNKPEIESNNFHF